MVPLFHTVLRLLSQVDGVFHDIIVQLDCCISVEYRSYRCRVDEKMLPEKVNSQMCTSTKEIIRTALALPPTCIALNQPQFSK